MMNQKRGLTDSVSCHTMEITGLRRKLMDSGGKEKQFNSVGPSNRQEAPAQTN